MIINVINSKNGIINSFTKQEVDEYIKNKPIMFPYYDLQIDKSIKNVSANSFIFYEKNNRYYPIPLDDNDFNNFINNSLSLRKLRKKYGIPLKSQDDIVRPEKTDERKFIRKDTDDRSLIMRDIPISESKKIGEGAYGFVFYDHESKTIKKTSEKLENTLVEFLAIKANPIYERYDYKINFDTLAYSITSKISGEMILSDLYPPKNINSRKTARLILDILLQLQYLHTLGIYHRDIKSNNILVSKEDGNYISHFIDFGIAYIDVAQDDKNNHSLSFYCADSSLTLRDKKPDIEKADVCALGTVFVSHITDKKVSVLKSKNLIADITASVSPDIPSQELLHFISCMCNPNIDERYTVEKLINHPYLSSYPYKKYIEQYPFVPYSPKDNLNENIPDRIILFLQDIKWKESAESHHTRNLFTRCVNKMEKLPENQSELKHLYKACYIISSARLDDVFIDKYEFIIENQKIYEYMKYMLNNLDCRCGIFESQTKEEHRAISDESKMKVIEENAIFERKQLDNKNINFRNGILSIMGEKKDLTSDIYLDRDIKHLSIINCEFKSFPHPDFPLESLKIEGCPNIQFIPEMKVNRLDITNCINLENIHITELVELICWRCPKIVIPDIRISMFLNCSNCPNLEIIPKLSGLQRMVCSNNPKLTKISNIQGLKQLICERIPIRNIPPIVGLQTLKCEKCIELESIPNIEGLKNLDCSWSVKIKKIPLIDGLKVLTCRECVRIKEIPDIPTLEYLDCRDCSNLVKIPDNKYRYLDVHGTRVV